MKGKTAAELTFPDDAAAALLFSPPQDQPAADTGTAPASLETMMRFATRRDPRLVMARNIALHHHQSFNGRGYPPLRPGEAQGESLQADDNSCFNCGQCRPLAGRDIPVEGLIVGLADRYDALRSPSQYKPPLTHDETLALMTSGDGTGVSGRNWYGEAIWAVFERVHPELERHYAEMADGGSERQIPNGR